MRTKLLLMAIVLSTACHAIKVKKGEFERISYYVKAQGTATGNGFEYVVYDSEGYMHSIRTTVDQKITVWSYHAGGSKNTRSSISWDIYPKKTKPQIKEDEKKVDGFYTYINKSISSKVKVRR